MSHLEEKDKKIPGWFIVLFDFVIIVFIALIIFSILIPIPGIWSWIKILFSC